MIEAIPKPSILQLGRQLNQKEKEKMLFQVQFELLRSSFIFEHCFNVEYNNFIDRNASYIEK